MNTIYKILVVACAYAVAGGLGSLFSIPPEFASSIWPAAGVGLAAALTYGPRIAFIGVYLGSIIINGLIVYIDSDSLVTHSLVLPSILSLGVSLQALVGYFIISKLVTLPIRFVNQKQTLTFLIVAGPLSCMVSTVIATAAFIFTGTIPLSEIPFTAFTWWVGDTVGTLFFAPLIIVALAPKKVINKGRRLQVVLPSLIMFLIVSWFFAGSREYQHQQKNRALIESSYNLVELIERQSELTKNKLLALTAIYRGTKYVGREEFATFAAILFENDNSIQALEWVPIVSHAERVNYEFLAQNEGYSDFEFKEMSENRELVSADSRPLYYPVYYVEPYEGNEVSLGFDLGSNKERKAVLEQARDSGRQTASQPIKLVQKEKKHPGFLIVSPLYEHSGFGIPDNLKDRRDRISGFALGVFNSEEMVKSALNLAESKNIELLIEDVTDSENPIHILSTVRHLNETSNTLQVDVAGRTWQISISPNDRYNLLSRDWNSWSILIVGIILAILLQAFILLITGFNESKQEEIEQKTKDLKKARKEAEDASQAKSDFLANMSHEFRTPLNAIIGLNDLTLKTELTTTQQNYLNKVKSASRTLLHLINDTLDFSKIEAGKMELEHTPFDLNELLTKIEMLFQHAAHEKNIQFNVQKPSNVLTQLIGDPFRLEQILLNLCSNALKFTNQGSVNVSVSATPVNSSSLSLLFSISDTGIGISPEQQKKLFSSFKQADTSTTRKYGGTGLGLTISKRLIELMEGSITLQSEEGKGSTFAFAISLPSSEQPVSEPNQKQPPLAEEAGYIESLLNSDKPLLGLKLLVVEDNLVNQLIAEEVLNGFGAETVLAENGKIALEKLKREGPFAAVLMDIQMPVMDGYETTERIRENPAYKDLPIIAMTANAMSSDREQCLKAGMNDHLPKPFEPEEVARAIVKWINAN
ncbi:CHASE domain-containing protein [Alkalimarinus sediminis]|uniref:Sensory/regulatory protein RpfC n=1 Tax=Alkalimarinus sediminis TaxID=1632866 RepID=A0A9E8HPQ4_9ALTE|nr:CHASE domain-containing protein [Alkalimarinus sediminis]UZW73559.1 CHASE domain-containing protein [Alkalimarinus sediminis]